MNLTKAKNKREETVAREYRNFVGEFLNPELPKSLRINFIHWDVKEKKKDKKNFPNELFRYASKMLSEMGYFSCLPTKLENRAKKVQDKIGSLDLCTLNIQRGITRTNCIDSLDRTNFA